MGQMPLGIFCKELANGKELRAGGNCWESPMANQYCQARVKAA